MRMPLSPKLLRRRRDTKVIVSFSQLQQLIPTVCVSQGCGATLSVSKRFRGCGVVISMKCNKGHTFIWGSSPEHLDVRNQTIYSNNLLMAAACLTSGNSYAKILDSRILEKIWILRSFLVQSWGEIARVRQPAANHCLCAQSLALQV